MFKTTFSFIIIYSFFFFNVEAKDRSSRLSLGSGLYNFMKHGSVPYNKVSIGYNIEYFYGKKLFNFLKPFAGFLGTDDSQFYGYGGLSSDLYFLRCKCFVVTPSLAFGFYDDGEGIRMGHLVEFRSGGDFTYRFKNNVRLGLGIFHISNAGMGYRNPGTEQIIFKYQIPIN